MPVLIRDEHLEKQIKREQAIRGHATMSKTLSELAKERLRELEVEARDPVTGEPTDDNRSTSPATAAKQIPADSNASAA